jgi:hypothetical protein
MALVSPLNNYEFAVRAARIRHRRLIGRCVNLPDEGYKQAELLRSQVYPIALHPGCVVLRIHPEVSRL